MTMQRARFSKAILGAAALATAIGCAQSVGDIDRTQPNAVRKELFGGVWYFRETITDVPATSSFTFIGETSGMEKIRWEITEEKLIGYRAYEAVPGTDVNADPVDKAPGSTRYRRGLSEGRNGEYKENPVVAFAISSHFDILRSYNSQTGEQSNVMSENTTDRPWYQRKYMRIDWSKNLVANFLFTSSWASQMGVNYVQQNEGGDDAFYAEDSAGRALSKENDIRHAADLGYFDFTSKLFVTPDLWGCILSFYGQGYEDCSSAEVKIRLSFAKVAAESEYEPLPYSDKDQAKFGYFRTERITYNRDRGATESGRIYLANRHPIWKESYVKGADGKQLRVCSSAFRATTPEDRDRGALDLTKDSSYFRAGVHLAEPNGQPLAICKSLVESMSLGAVTLPGLEGQDYQLTDESFFVVENGKVLVKKFAANGSLFEYPGAAPVADVKANLADPCDAKDRVWVRVPARIQSPSGSAKLGCLKEGAKVLCDNEQLECAYRRDCNRRDLPVDQRPMLCSETDLVKANMPFALREPKPITYYASVHHPVQLIPSLENIAKSWNRAFKKSAALAMGKPESAIPDMFVLDLNGYDEFQTPKDLSNDQWVDRRAIASVSFDESQPSERWANGNRIGSVIIRYSRLASDDDSTVDADRRAMRCKEFDTVGPNSYYAECVSNASYTSDGGRTRIFTFNAANVKARIGDVRKNVIWWVDSPQLYSPWGYGPSAADPETGEIISGTAYVYGAPTDSIAMNGVDIVKLLNNKLKIQDLIDGTSVRDHIMANLERVDPRHMVGETTSFKELADHDDLMGKVIGKKTVDRIKSLKQTGLPEGYKGWLETRMSKIKGTPIAEMMMNHEEVRQAAGISPFDTGAAVTPRQQEKMESAVFGLPTMMRKNKERIAKASKNNIWLAEFGDDAIMGLALEFANKYNQQYELSSMEEQAKIDREVWGEIRTRIYRAVTEHEVGHTLGLRHNFQGSFDSLNFFDEYWRLRQQTLKGPEASNGTDSLVRFNGNRVAGYNLNHALEQATFSDEQKIGKMREFQYSTVMDYGARLNSDIHGTGKYDDAAIVYAYTGQTRVTPKSDIVTEAQLYPLRPGTSANRFYCQNGALASPVGRDEWRCVESGYVEIFDSAKLPITYAKLPKLLQTYNDRPAPVFKALTEMVHYSQLPYLMGGGKLQGICRGNTKCDVCFGAEDDTAAGSGSFEGFYAFRLKSMFPCDTTKDLQSSVVEGGDATKGLEVIKARNWARGNEVRKNKTLVEVPYLFCGDEYVGSTGNCNRWDEGADAFEITKNVIDSYENYYFFNNFKRDRYGFDSSDVLMRVYGRYFTVLPNVYQNWLFAQFSDGFGLSHAILDAIGAFEGFNELTSVLTRPRYGTHFEANNQWYACTYQMKNVKDCGNPDLQGNPRRPVTSVPMGAGRRFFTRYDYSSGYNMYDKVLESGHYWEVIAALFAIAESEATVVGADTGADFRTFLLPYFLVFPTELTHYYNSIILEDDEAVGARLSPQPDGTAKVFSVPGYDYVANYVNGTDPSCTTNAADPRPFRRCTLNPPAGLKFARLGVQWMQRIYTLYLGMAGFTSFLSVPYPDQAKVFKLGAGEAVQAGDGYTLVEYTNPKRGFRYAALSKNGVTEARDKTLAVRSVEKGKALYDRWVAETDPDTKADLENEIDSASDDLDLLRWMYDIYGRAW